MDTRKRAEIDYPDVIGEPGLEWLRTKPFGNAPRESARHIIDFGYVLQLLELQRGMSLCELGCGPGWLTRLAARHGVEAFGYDISPQMVAIAQEQAELERVNARFEVGDMEQLVPDRTFDACVIYDALHHTPRADLVLASAHTLLRPGGRLLLAEPNWKHRFQGREDSSRWGTTELGYTSRQLKKLLRQAGFVGIERFHNNRKRLFSNSIRDLVLHVGEPLVYRLLAPFWTQIWLRAVRSS